MIITVAFFRDTYNPAFISLGSISSENDSGLAGAGSYHTVPVSVHPGQGRHWRRHSFFSGENGEGVLPVILKIRIVDAVKPCGHHGDCVLPEYLFPCFQREQAKLMAFGPE